MARQRRTAEQIINKLREAEVGLAPGGRSTRSRHAPRVRLGAARLALSFGFRVLEDEDINELLDILESGVHTCGKERNRRAF